MTKPIATPYLLKGDRIRHSSWPISAYLATTLGKSAHFVSLYAPSSPEDAHLTKITLDEPYTVFFDGSSFTLKLPILPDDDSWEVIPRS